ncbi:unnamed protein product [Cyprideis torosa]|uniref:Uncharacterized protein n=1 Tax=Cyprideis torosa TaxID=163714 RepID=A0A7R8ZP11_9CRUS|nr:unnamed protein product [Cyprideis torosa]CAG0892835.1 unnamed protein product [Cyprideis torosa]
MSSSLSWFLLTCVVVGSFSGTLAKDAKAVKCQEGQIPVGDRCYLLVKEVATDWAGANYLCGLLAPNSTLAKFEEAKELVDMTLYLGFNESDCSTWGNHSRSTWSNNGGPWIGASQKSSNSEEVFVWVGTGQDVVYYNWADPQRNPGASDAVYLDCYTNYAWRDVPQDSPPRPFICETEPLPDPECPELFDQVGSTCYWLSEAPNNWPGARSWCNGMVPNGKLAETETIEEVIAMATYLNQNDAECSIYGRWIGGREEGTTNVFYWDSTGDPIQNFNWADGHPNNLNANSTIWISCQDDYTWYDLDSDISQYFICEFDLETAPRRV